ncbi:phage tail protein [Sphaerisporangium rhizosphaerae]|uniref:Phage tail protein n=1 Tax=Sphaerisporangium rhizosphaerae TaxID=2269375 RepID=A0ABW2PEC4_9ACTN
MREYRYLNVEGRWRGMHLSGLDLGADGSLRLASLPLAPEVTVIPGDAARTAPAGIVVLPDGDVLFTDPERNRLLCVRGREGAPYPLVYGTPRTPRGLAYHPARRAVLVADAGSGRIVLLDARTRQVSEVWERFAAPVSLAAGPAGAVAVVDDGRVRLLDQWGREAGRVDGPAATAVAAAPGGLLVLRASGLVQSADWTGAITSEWDTGLARATALCFTGHRVLVGDGERGLLAVYEDDGRLVGTAAGFRGPVAAIAADDRLGILLNTGAGEPPARLTPAGACRTSGSLWGGPYRDPLGRRDRPRLVRAHVAGTGYTLHVTGSPPAGPPGTDPAWTALPPDTGHTLLTASSLPGPDLWVGVSFSSTGTAGPVLSQIRVDFGPEGYLRHLPAVYGEPGAAGGPADFMARWLAVFESTFGDLHEEIEDLPALFDPSASPDPGRLAGWLGLEAGAGREAIRDAFAAHARRGTPGGLRAALEAAGADAVVEESARSCGWWSLPEGPEAGALVQRLGVGTVLGAIEPPVLGRGATLDASVLGSAPYRMPPTAETAHRFTVRVRRGPGFHDGLPGRVRAVVEREKPAHTAAHVCVVEPRMRVGVQAILGVDTVLGGPRAATALGDLGPGGLVLGGEPPPRLGGTSVAGHAQI